MLSVERVVVDNESVVTHYKASQSFCSPDGPRTVTQGLTVTEHRKWAGFEAKLSFDKCAGESAEEALDRLANWCEQIGQAIRNRGPASPLVAQYTQPINQDALETDRIERLVMGLWASGVRAPELFVEACGSRRRAATFWERGFALKAAGDFTVADVLIDVFRPGRRAELLALQTSDEDSAYEQAREDFYEIARGQLAWT